MENLPKLTVSELSEIIKSTLETAFFGLTVEGEISDFKLSSTGHWYFSLKDEGALINAVVWKSAIPRINFAPKNGQKVIVTGSISVYPPSGRYQINCTSMRMSGDGDILAKLEERKKYYATRGYFDESLKKPIPRNPQKVAIITSPTGAALQDILQVTGRRNPSLEIVILPAPVQGDEAAPIISQRIADANEYCIADVIIVGRGGGSLEDLLPFSEDCVIEAIHNSEIPVISAVGHEIDWAISDFVSDLRAPTPSAAAELVCESSESQMQRLANIKNEIIKVTTEKVNIAYLKYLSIHKEGLALLQGRRIDQFRMTCEKCIDDSERAVSEKLVEARNKVTVIRSTLKAASPVAILERGYAIVTDSENKTVRNINNLRKDSSITIRFADGKADAKITEIENGI